MIEHCRVHITGASGAGVTTLGRALADALAVPHHDTDDYYWLPTNPPYHTKRPVEDRLRLMHEMFAARSHWVLSGSLSGWGDPLAPLFDLIVFVSAPTNLRLARIRAREARRYGADALADGGSRHRESEAFLAWAARYDDDTFDGRNRRRHELWLSEQTAPVVRVEGTRPLQSLVSEVAKSLPQRE